MQITKDILDYCESCYKWDEDIRQEVYATILEMDETEINKAWCVTVYNNLVQNNRRDEQNRARLRTENYAKIVQELGLNVTADDPQDITAMREAILINLNSLSPLLRGTLGEYYLAGRSPEEIAEIYGENVEAVRKRITRARNILKGEV